MLTLVQTFWPFLTHHRCVICASCNVPKSVCYVYDVLLLSSLNQSLMGCQVVTAVAIFLIVKTGLHCELVF